MKFLVLVFMTCFCSLFAQIYETSTINEMKNYEQEGALFIYDLDNTLIRPDQYLGTDEWFYYRFTKLKKEIGSDKALEKALAEWIAIQYISKVTPIERNSDKMIATLQEKDVSIIGLSTRGMSMARCTHTQLNSLNIDLTKTAPSKETLYFKESGVLYKNGIVFTSATSKGKALEAFLDKISLSPTKVVFINDKLTHLKDLEQGCKAKGIPFIGLRFNALDEKVKSMDKEKTAEQFHQIYEVLKSQK